MIRIHRTEPEPTALTNARVAALAKLASAPPTSREEVPATYQVAKDELWRSQGFKCAYCETREQKKRNDAEHFRPAAKYWWLAWTWENLLFSCANCNQAPAKLDKFPLEDEATRLVPTDPPPGKERPLLIDPLVESGVAHIQFRLDASSGHWVPMPRDTSRRGAVTIATCMLGRPDLLDLYSQRVGEVQPEIDRISKAVAAEDPKAITSAWEDFVARHVHSRALYAGLMWDLLDQSVPDEVKTRYSLAMPSL